MKSYQINKNHTDILILVKIFKTEYKPNRTVIIFLFIYLFYTPSVPLIPHFCDIGGDFS